MRTQQYTSDRRQRIIEDFAKRHGGRWEAGPFLDEVQARGRQHPAHAWFEWNEASAARAHRLDQARAFSQGLKIVFRIQDVARSGSVKVKHGAVPLVLSPMDGRKSGGGYVLTDPTDPTHMAELAQQGAAALRSWLNRYRAAVAHVGGSPEAIEGVIAVLETATPAKLEAA